MYHKPVVTIQSVLHLWLFSMHTLCFRINELYTSLSEQTRKREEGLHTVDMVLREKDHAAQAERLQMTSKVTDTVEDINKRLLAKEMKIREEIQQKFLQLEKVGI